MDSSENGQSFGVDEEHRSDAPAVPSDGQAPEGGGNQESPTSGVHRSDDPAVPSDGQAPGAGGNQESPTSGVQKTPRQKKKKALAAANAWLKYHDELGASITGSPNGSSITGTPSVTQRGVDDSSSVMTMIPASANGQVMRWTSATNKFEGVSQGSGMIAQAEQMPVLENPDAIQKVDAHLVRQNSDGEEDLIEQYTDKEHLSKMYVANGGGKSELEKQEQARLHKSLDMIICWQDLSVSVADHANERQKTVISNVSGFVEAGQILAVCGCSGAGKSALLQTIAGTLSPSLTTQISGDLSVNGVKVDGRLLTRSAVAYVPQARSFLPSMTVRQALRSEASLCPCAANMSPQLLCTASGFGPACNLKRRVRTQGRDRRCSDLLSFLKLEACADKKIGGGFLPESISKAEHRRLCLAAAIIDNPSVILMDAFDDGLAAADSDKLIGPLLGLASQGTAIVLTSAQPSSKLWGSASTVCLMTQGRCKFFGAKEEAVPYFNGVCGSACPLRCNPAEYFMGLMDPANDALDSAAARASQWNMALGAVVGERIGEGGNHASLGEVVRPSASTFGPLVSRALRHNVATSRCFLGRLAAVVLAAFVAGAMFEGVGKNKKAMEDSSVSGRSSAFFALQCLALAALPLLPVVRTEHTIMAQDVALKHHNRAPHVAAVWVARLPFSLLFALIASLLVALWTSIGFDAFHFIFLSSFFSLLAAEGLVASIAALNLEALLSSTLAAMLCSFFLFCQGYFRAAQDIPPWLIWGHYISFSTYAFRAMMVSEFTSDLDPHNEILQKYGMEDEDAGASLAVLVGFAGFFQVAWLVLLLSKQLSASNLK